MITNLYAEESAASRMLSLIARKAPLLMRVGGGVLPREEGGERRGPTAMTPEKRARALALGRAGEHNATQISRIVGSSQSAVCNLLMREGVKVPDGRTLAMRKKEAR